MESIKEKNDVLVKLSNVEALVLFDWISKFNADQVRIRDSSEEKVLFDLESVLEQQITDSFDEDYVEKLKVARDELKQW